jgi:hypothetical protein
VREATGEVVASEMFNQAAAATASRQQRGRHRPIGWPARGPGPGHVSRIGLYDTKRQRRVIDDPLKDADGNGLMLGASRFPDMSVNGLSEMSHRAEPVAHVRESREPGA